MKNFHYIPKNSEYIQINKKPAQVSKLIINNIKYLILGARTKYKEELYPTN